MRRALKWSLLLILSTLIACVITWKLATKGPAGREEPANPSALAAAARSDTLPDFRAGTLPAYQAGAAPIYRAEAMILISFGRGKRDTAEEPVVNLNEHLNSKAMLITSRMMIHLAMETRQFKDTGLPGDATTLARMMENIVVEHPQRTELLRVYYFDTDPKIAGKLVQAIVRAFTDYSSAQSQHNRIGQNNADMMSMVSVPNTGDDPPKLYKPE